MTGLKQRLINGQAVIGTFLSLGNAITAEIISNAGFDWVIIDLEHGVGAENDVVLQLMALKNAGVAAIIRVESYQRQRIQRVLDLGADGIMCPKVDSPEEAAQAVQAMHYPPGGNRGVAKMTRATEYGARFDQYLNTTHERLLGVVQIETLKALEHLEAIAAIREVDVLFIGPSDLSMALGVFGQTSHPLFTAAVDRIISVAKMANKQVGILLPDPSEVKQYYRRGIHFIACGTDASFLSKGAKQAAAAMRDALV